MIIKVSLPLFLFTQEFATLPAALAAFLSYCCLEQQAGGADGLWVLHLFSKCTYLESMVATSFLHISLVMKLAAGSAQERAVRSLVLFTVL